MTRPSTRRLLPIVLGVCALAVVAVSARGLLAARLEWQTLPHSRIATIDFYGLRTVTEPQVRAAVNLREGDIAPTLDHIDGAMKVVRWLSPDNAVETRREVEQRLEQLPGVARAKVTPIIANNTGRVALFVGIEERNNPSHFSYRPAPAGTAASSGEIASLYSQHQQAFGAAIASDPQLDSDDSQGHALFTNAHMRAIEDQMITFDASHLELVRQVLKNSQDGNQREAAAWVIGYAPDKRLIVADLMEAARDPDEGVRNNSTRALALIASFAGKRPDLGIHIDSLQFIDMLNSLIWTDRNKAAGVLDGLTETPNPETLRILRERAMPALIEMARWKDSHSEDYLRLIGRIAGMSEHDIQTALDHGERERILAMATCYTIPKCPPTYAPASLPY